jgi:protein-tyrosine-phosphatase
MPTVLFVCKANQGRSVMSQALLERVADGRHHAISAGSQAVPGTPPHPVVVEAMREIGIDISHHGAQPLTFEIAAQADVVVTMGCGDACPAVPGRKQLRIDWDLPDPQDADIDTTRAIRDDITRRVEHLVDELDGLTTEVA